MEWCEDEDVLRGIFLLTHVERKNDLYCDLVCKFIREYTCWQLVEDDHKAIQYMADVLAMQNKSIKKNRVYIKWIPTYRCALIARLGQGCQPTQVRYLSLLGLENWRFHVEGSPNNVRKYTSACEGYANLTFKPVKEEDFEEFLDCYKRAFNKAIADDENRRRKSSSQKHKKTPAFIEAALKNAHLRLECKDEGSIDQIVAIEPRGGWSDVTVHTGGGWSLVSAVCKYLLTFSPNPIHTDLDTLYCLFLCHFELWLLERQLHVSTKLLTNINSKHSDTVYAVDVLMQMLSSVARRVCLLEKKQDDMHFFLERCIMVRKRLDTLITNRSNLTSCMYDIKLDSLDAFLKPRIRLDLSPGGGGVCNRDDIVKLSRKNDAAIPLAMTYEYPSPDISDLLEWVKLINKDNQSHLLLLLSTIESFLIRKSKDLNFWVNVEVDVSLLEELIFVYRRHVNVYLSRLASKETGKVRSVLRVEIISKEVLIVWIAYCLIHKHLRNKFPLIGEYSVALQWRDIRYFVLNSKEMIEASLAVSEYLKINGGGLPLFSLKNQEGTFSMAEKFTNQSAELSLIRQHEESAAQERVEAHWKVVQEKQQLVKQLEIEKDDKEDERKSLKNKLRKRKDYLEEQGYNYSRHYDSKKSQLEDSIEDVERQLRNLDARIGTAKISPEPVLQPLPKNKSYAGRVLFFLHMPKNMEVLSRFTIMAQQMLLPNSQKFQHTAMDKEALQKIQESVKFPKPPNQLKTSLAIYYNGHLPYSTSTSKSVEIHSYTEPPKKVSLFNVMSYHSKTDGIWYPDSLSPIMVWRGGNFVSDQTCYFFNPFENVGPQNICRYFTERCVDESLQWIMPQYGEYTCPSRGNQPIAYQCKKPDWLKKNQWLEFANIRAFPYEQLRNICRIISNRSLPLDHPTVHQVMTSALFHLGDVSDGLKLEWKNDQFIGDFGKIIEEELHDIAEELSTKPRANRSLLLLIEIAGYVTQWNPSCKRICRKFATILTEWMKDLDEQMTNADPKNVINLRVKKSLFCKYAILCYSKGMLTRDDASKMCRLILLAHKYDAIFDENETRRKEVESLTIKSQDVICSRIAEILREAEADNYAMFTAALKEIIHDTPDYLKWTGLCFPRNKGGEFTATSFEAWSTDNNMYSVNLANGIVLLNGKPISQLPVSVLDHPLYKRTFSTRNFETFVSKEVFHTVMPVKGCLYTFELNEEELIIHEIDTSSNYSLRLLPCDGLWCKQFPVRLRTMHSHWYCSQTDTILFRDIDFCQRNVDFFMKKEESWTCFRVSPHLRKHIWDKFCQGTLDMCPPFDKLLINNALREIFNKFEKRQFIHVYSSANATIVELPRFKLQFQWKSGSSTITSLDYTGYRLSNCQQLNDTLIGFKQYLLLDGDVEGYKHTKVIVPVGKIQKCDDGVVVIGDTRCDFEWATYCYDIHPRFKNLQANSIEARLQLAELYAATGTLLPEKRMKMTGGEVAMKLVRQCWTNQPMEASEYERLANLSVLCHRTPGLSLLCYEVGTSSLQTEFLYSERCRPVIEHPVIEHPVEASNEYFQRRSPSNPRSTLSGEEEFRIFGKNRSVNVDTYMWAKNYQVAQQIKESGIDGMDASEAELLTYLVTMKKNEDPFQFGDGVLGTGMEKSVIAELRESEKVYKEMVEYDVAAGLLHAVERSRDEIKERRRLLEEFLMKNIAQINLNEYPVILFQILRAANISPLLQLEDIMKAACSINHLKHFNPFLSTTDLDTLKLEILKWLQLCVLEDKLNRLCKLSRYENKVDEKGSALHVVKELRNVRSWSVEKHPEWLVFEVLSRLQIRPLQYSVAMSIINKIDNDCVSPITQLNMGEGKTRVILPMLILYWMKSEKLVRLNLLSTLIHEAYDYLHRHLGATLFECKLHLLPFNRDNHLTADQAQTIHESLRFCLNSNGILLVTPQHRQSLHLKRYEMMQVIGEGDTCEILEQIEKLCYVDLLDECDEILRMKNKLIYACGSQEPLPSGNLRWRVLQTLVQIIRRNPIIHKLLSKPGVVHWKQKTSRSSEAFHEFRIVDGEEFQNIKYEFYEILFDELTNEPPYELRWIKKFNLRKLFFVNYVTRPDVDVELPKVCTKLQKMAVEFLLSLRGYLANGLLVHCLMKRNRVEYGIKRPSKKRMAVPFHAVETPAPRAEFGHPDCSIIYSTLAYYYDGLTKGQIVEAFNILLSLGDTAQESIYGMWYKLSEPSIAHGSCTETLDSVSKIDLSNGILLSLLVKYYQYNIDTINFWLEHLVFPLETMQFPKRLEATAWDIATNNSHQIAGFSGTNDDKVLLPSSLSWIESNDDELKATDGKMMQLISNHASFHSLTDATNQVIPLPTNVPQWMLILDLVIIWCKTNSGRICALIDAGALMAGVPSNKYVAVYLAERLDPVEFQGVVYFHDNDWWVRDHHGREWPKHSSPIHERDAFVYFDESRCRGADMRLRINSHAVLTLGPKMCKDKLMQAAGRMRQLENGQKIMMLALDDVTKSIRSMNNINGSSEITAVHVLKWALSNTIASVAKWLPEWGVQGGHHVIKQDNADLAMLPDMLDLQQMYGHKLSEKPVTDVWKQWRSILLARRNDVELPIRAGLILEDINKRMEKYGCDVSAVFSNFEEECERELEKEIELEQEYERKVPSVQPRTEKDWDVHNLVSHNDVETVIRNTPGTNIQSLASFIGTNIYYEGKAINREYKFCWPGNIYGTENFFVACQRLQRMTSLSYSFNDYLRLVNSFLLFPSGDILLLSERETDKVLQYSWKAKGLNKCCLLDLTYALKKHEKDKKVKFQILTSGVTCPNVGENALVALQLFQGGVTYEGDSRKKAIRKIVCDESSKAVASIFPAIRGLSHTYQRSDLEELCAT